MAATPTRAQVEALTTQVDQLVIPQANVFIRELVRGLGKPLGTNKEAYRASLVEAITEGALDKQRLDTWLYGVEGWGNQHIYAFAVPREIRADRTWDDEAAVQRIAEAAFRGSWRAPISRTYPDKPRLTRIDFDPARGQFLVEWQESTERWVRDKAMDGWPQQASPQHVHPDAAAAPEGDPMRDALLIDGDTYWFKAHRREYGRAVMRFAMRLRPRRGQRAMAALFLRVPVRSPEHEAARDVAWTDLAKLVFGGVACASARNAPWSISTLIKNLDAGIVGEQEPDFKSKSTKFAEGQASVEFVAPPSLEMPENIMNVRLAITPDVIKSKAFVGSAGDFRMRKDPERQGSREAHVQLFQPGNRIRILTELDENDVWAILDRFARLL